VTAKIAVTHVFGLTIISRFTLAWTKSESRRVLRYSCARTSVERRECLKEPDTQLDAESWLRQQNSVIQDLFDRATTELQGSGIRILLGSTHPTLTDMDYGKRVTIQPIRFTDSNGSDSLSLSLSATIKGGPPRYVVVLEATGSLTCQALEKLSLEHEDVWNKLYLRTGLWIGEPPNTRLLSDVSQIRGRNGDRIRIAGAFLHSDLGRTVEQGVMVIGVLYRGILDQLSDAGKMRRLYAQLHRCLDHTAPRFQRIIHP
jgi:hypothetical protein